MLGGTLRGTEFGGRSSCWKTVHFFVNRNRRSIWIGCLCVFRDRSEAALHLAVVHGIPRSIYIRRSTYAGNFNSGRDEVVGYSLLQRVSAV